jgi:all-trans-retinol 13,14-reductase
MSNNYDVIIIGAGISGLLAGALLSERGKKVLLLESHAEIGGYLSGFTRKGVLFRLRHQPFQYILRGTVST